MAFKTFRDASRETFGSTSAGGEAPKFNLDQLSLGCLQRMADASEAMAKNHNDLIRDLKWMREDRDRWKRSAEEAQRSGSALRGVVTKKDKRIEQLETELADLRKQAQVPAAQQQG